MSTELDNLLQKVGRAASLCYDLNSNGTLTTEEQTVFYQYAEHIVLELSQMHSIYDELAVYFAQNAAKLQELNDAWDAAIDALGNLNRNVTSPKVRAAVAATASAIDKTSSVFAEI